MKHSLKYLFSAILLLAAVSCSEVSDYLDEEPVEPVKEQKKQDIDIRSIRLSDGGRFVTVSANVLSDVGDIELGDSAKVRLRVCEMKDESTPYSDRVQPVPAAVNLTGARILADSNASMDIIVDLTLPQSVVDEQLKAVKIIRRVFTQDRLNLSFMDGNGIRETVPATDYVLEHYFSSVSNGGSKYLFRSVSSRLKAMTDVPDSLAGGARKILTVFSDGKIYSRNLPIDPKHFRLQDELIDATEELGDSMAVFYVHFGTSEGSNEAGNFMRGLCDNSNGMCQDRFNWQSMGDFIFKWIGVEHTDYEFVLRNPRFKVYQGWKHILLLDIVSGEEVLAHGESYYAPGNFNRPVVVGGFSHEMVIIQGVIITLILAFVLFVIFQLIVPKISNIVFKRKYVRTYSHENMSVGGILVERDCYYCKAPFVPGDTIVARCKHVMHKECWDENGYHCPEYGRNCKEGSHYYNPSRLLDPGNAPYYLRWILAGLVSGLVSWLVFSLAKDDFSMKIIEKMVMGANKIVPGSAEAVEYRLEHIASLNQLPSFGLYFGFVLTLALSALSIHRKGWLHNCLEALLRSVAGAVAGYLCFFGGCVLNIVLDLNEPYLIDWIPWSVTGFAIAFISTFRTNVEMRRKWVWATIAIGLVTMYLWDVVFAGLGLDYRIPLLLSHIIFSVGIALSVAAASPRSERYYFHVGGAMKEMDIAIYKWFSANTNRVVTVGRSVDCDLVMSWDMTGDIAPVQANITKQGSHICITPLEEGVKVKGRDLPAGKPKRLYHGTRFTIGKTEFVYEEKDI